MPGRKTLTREEGALLGVMHARQRQSPPNTGHSRNGVEPSPRDPLPLEAPACSKAQVGHPGILSVSIRAAPEDLVVEAP
eukprot:s849_g12.t1